MVLPVFLAYFKSESEKAFLTGVFKPYPDSRRGVIVPGRAVWVERILQFPEKIDSQLAQRCVAQFRSLFHHSFGHCAVIVQRRGLGFEFTPDGTWKTDVCRVCRIFADCDSKRRDYDNQNFFDGHSVFHLLPYFFRRNALFFPKNAA